MRAVTAYSLPSLEEHFLFRGEMELVPRTVLPFHRKSFEKITDWALGCLPDGKRHLIICMPPGHGKTLMAHDAVSWLISLFPDSMWIYASYAAQLAVTQTMRIRDIMASDWYRAVYPAAGLRQGQGTMKYFETMAGGSVYGTGLDGSITGFRAGRKRDEFGGGIVIDDPLKPLEARSETMRNSVNTWFTDTMLSRRNHDRTPIMLIMQRLHEEDLVGHVLATMPGQWDLLSIPAMNENTGEMLWPETFSQETAEMLREVDPATFYAQYQQTPRNPGGNIIKLGWWRTYAPESVGRGGLTFLTADTAFKAKKINDASVIQAWHGTDKGLFLLDAVYGRWEFPRLLEQARSFWSKWREKGAREFWVEDKASGTPLAQLIREEGIPAMEWKPADFDFADDKPGRMNSAAVDVHGGKVFVPEGAIEVKVDEGKSIKVTPEAFALLDECASFSPDMSHAHDDHCDAFTMAVSLWRSAGGGR